MRRRGATGPSPPAHGYIGERYDDAAGLQYLNARYYDPRLAMFIQPDWWEVTQAGVGTNRYSYSFGDPVNGRDPTGHQALLAESLPAPTTGVVVANINAAPSGAITSASMAESAFGAAIRTLGAAFAGVATGLFMDTNPAVATFDGAWNQQVGAALTQDMVRQGFYIDGSGRIMDPFGEPLFNGTGGAAALFDGQPYKSFKSFDRLKRALGSAGRRCCKTLSSKDSHRESMRLDGAHEQAITRPLPHDELVQLHGVSAQARIPADLVGQGHVLACAA